MPPPLIRKLPNEAQGLAIDQARTAVDIAVAAINSWTDGPAASVVREKLGVKGDGPWREFRSTKAGNHVGLANSLYYKLLASFHDPILGKAATAARQEIDAALVALAKVLAQFGQYRTDHIATARTLVHFGPLDAEHSLFAFDNSPTPLPLPRFVDFEDGDVIEPRAALVLKQLEAEGSCWLRGVHTFGKTTTALVAAFKLKAAGISPYFIDLGESFDSDQVEIRSEFEHLTSSQAPCLLLVDNVHRFPGLVRQLAKIWSQLPRGHGHRLLIIGTEIAHASGTAVTEMLTWPPNTLQLRIGPETFEAIARFYVNRHGHRIIAPPAHVYTNWSKLFGNNLHAFCLALLQKAANLGRDDRWSLNQDDALSWIRNNWLHRKAHGMRYAIDPKERLNLLCISTFSEQDLELLVQVDALPHSDNFVNSRQIGLVREKVRVRFEVQQERLIGLMEPGWGNLILLADGADPDEIQAIRRDAIKRYPRLGLAIATRYVNIGKIGECQFLFLQLSNEAGWLNSLARAGVSVICGWLQLLSRFWSAGAGPLRIAVNETIERYPEIIFQSTIGQLETMVRSFPPGIEPGEREALASLLSEFEVPSGSVLDHSFATGFSGLDLSILAALPKESRFSTDLRRGFATSVERSLEYALARGFQMVTELLQSIARYWPEGMEAAITTLSGSDSRTILHNQADKAILREFDPVNHFYRWNGEIDTRIVALFYQRFESVDWQVYTEPGRGGLATAPWLIKAMHSVEMSAAATRLADLLAQRRLSKDLHVPGHEGNKRIEMIAQVCLHCSSADAAAAYFEAMVPIVCACMREPKIYRGIVANGLWLLVRNDRIEPVRNDVNAALLERAVLNFGLKDGAFSEQSIADYMRLIGVVACGWPDAFLRQDTLEFVKRVGLEALLNHPISALPLPSVDLSFVPSHQMQYWLALFQISKIMKLPLLISRTTIDPLREKWRLNLAFDLENEPENQRVIYRHRVMLDWLDSAQGGAMALLRPGSADLRCA